MSMNAFEVLGLPPRLVLGDEEVKDAFREAGKAVHPDAGGNEADFAKLKEAHGIVSSPSRRLRHWLELRGHAVESRGTIDGELMDLFGEIGAVTQRAEELGRKRDEARSALAKAMLESQVQSSREEIERAISKVRAAIDRQCAEFSEIEAAEEITGGVSKIVRDLAFLEKWMAGLRRSFSRLV